MRALAFVLLIGGASACTPDIVSESYLCGPNASCPEDQKCNGADNICVTSSPEAFSCDFGGKEPNDSIETGQPLGTFGCTSLATSLDACMDMGDAVDWYTLTAPTGCDAVAIDSRLTFPTAWEDLALELWNVDTNERVGQSSKCAFGGEAGDELRCMNVTLDQGARYAIAVLPTGDGDCKGTCAYNRYALHMQLTLPH